MKVIDFIVKYGIQAYERKLAYMKIYREVNRDRILNQQRNYKKNNKVIIAIQRKGYGEDIKEELADYQKAYRQTPNGKAAHNRGQALRERNFGFIPLNTPFGDCEGHHITHNFVIYIPKALHKSVWHNLNTGQGMEAINALVLDFLVNGF